MVHGYTAVRYLGLGLGFSDLGLGLGTDYAARFALELYSNVHAYA